MVFMEVSYRLSLFKSQSHLLSLSPIKINLQKREKKIDIAHCLSTFQQVHKEKKILPISFPRGKLKTKKVSSTIF